MSSTHVLSTLEVSELQHALGMFTRERREALAEMTDPRMRACVSEVLDRLHRLNFIIGNAKKVTVQV